MKLAIFDIDGTLADTNKVDAECFARAVTEEYGINDIDLEWTNYSDVTDSGIAGTLYKRKFGMPPTETDLQRLRNRFVGHLGTSFAAQPASFHQIPGASDVLQHLTKRTDWSIAYATGGWYDSAIFKLKSAGLPCDQIPLATSDDGIDRVSIVKRSIELARRHFSTNHFERTVLIGDAQWDAQAAISLLIPFIGVGEHNRFHDFSSVCIITDFIDTTRFLQCLESASVPERTSHAHFA